MLELGDRGAGVSLGPVDEGQKALEVQVALVRDARPHEPGDLPRGHGEDAGAVVEQSLQDALALGSDSCAAREDGLRSPLGHEDRVVLTAARQDGGELALVVEGQHAEPLVGQRPVRSAEQRGSIVSAVEREVERVAADRAGRRHGRLVAHQAENERRRGGRAGRVERRMEGDGALGQRARLVGEEQIDVPEVLDGDEALDEDALARERARPAGEAHRHDGGQQLRRDADRDGQAEEQGVDQRPVEGDVDREDPHRQDAGDPDQQGREAPQPDLEGGLGRPLAEPAGDPPEGRGHARGHDDPFA